MENRIYGNPYICSTSFWKGFAEPGGYTCSAPESRRLPMLKITLLFIATALAEIIGCFLPYLWLRKGGSIWLLLPAAVSLALFVWLLSLHPAASGRVYAAYGGVYVAVALLWLYVVDGVKLSMYDWVGAGVALLGMGIIVMGWRGH